MLFFFTTLLIVLQVKEIVQLVYEGEKTVPYDGDRVEDGGECQKRRKGSGRQ